MSIYNFCKKYNLKNIGVSLSGGVDSVVLLYTLKQLEIEGLINKVVAIHINYNWCERNEIEKNYLIEFCDFIDVDLIVRNITHMSNLKININRDFIESETKLIRFKTYKYAIEKYSLNGICLGHHKNDIIENVFMNLIGGKNVIDLMGMNDHLLQFDVDIFRPMLSLYKNEIFETAHQHNLLYFKNTTPEWSFRGTIRNQLFPILQKFNSGFEDNLYNVGINNSILGNYIKDQIIDKIINTKIQFKYGFKITLDSSFIFFEQLFLFLFDPNIKKVTQKNLKEFNLWIPIKSTNSLFRLSNGYLVFKQNDMLYFMQCTIYNAMNKKIDNITYDIDFNNKYEYNNWTIKIGKTDVQHKKPKFNILYDDILDGNIHYNIMYGDSNKITASYTCKGIVKNVSLLSHLIPKVYSDGIKLNMIDVYLKY
jgi:tRNA(Ile)-lysidine synthetase-like protein